MPNWSILAAGSNSNMNKEIEDANNEIIQLQLEVDRSGDKLRSFFDTSSAIHLLIDTNKILIDFNRSAANFIKKYYNITITQGIEMASFTHEDHLFGFNEGYEAALSGNPVRAEKMLTYEGEDIYWFLTFEPAWDKDGNILGVSYNAIDISEKIANEFKILSQYNSLKEIAFIQSHEFRKPVMNIVGLMNVFAAEDYKSTREELIMLERAVLELEKLLIQVEKQSRK
jgi:PAS domain S-box-containing protein